MKFYSSDRGSNPQKVRIFLAEKGIELPVVKLDLMAQEHREPDYLQINSLGKLPALELDDGTVITESIAICRYLEALHPKPPLFGGNPVDKALVNMWCRRIELEVARPCTDVIQHSSPFFAERVEQVPEYAQAQRRQAEKAFRWLNDEMADGRPYVAGEFFSMADIILITTMGLAAMMKIAVPDELKAIHAWHERVKERPGYNA